MSKIQAIFNSRGRRLFESEKPVVDAFNAKYGRLAREGMVQPLLVAESSAAPLGYPNVPVEQRLTGAAETGNNSTPARKMGRKVREFKRRPLRVKVVAPKTKAAA